MAMMKRSWGGRRWGIGAVVTLATVFALAAVARADEAAKIDSGDTAWMLTSAALVLMMTAPGLALFYGGLVRSKSVLNLLMQSKRRELDVNEGPAWRRPQPGRHP